MTRWPKCQPTHHRIFHSTLSHVMTPRGNSWSKSNETVSNSFVECEMTFTANVLTNPAVALVTGNSWKQK